MRKIAYRSGYKYVLHSAYVCQVPIRPREVIATDFIQLGIDGTLIVSCGYAWDGASGPTIDSKSAMRASLVHDALYQLIREGLLPDSARQAADETLRDICIEDGMIRARAWLWYYAVRKFGALANKPKKIEVAP